MLSLILAIPYAVAAQNIDDPREVTRFGLKAGVNYSNVWDEDGQDFVAEGRVGFAGGLFFGIPIKKFLGVQPEILIVQKGFHGSGSMAGSPYSFSKTTTYLDIPILLQLKPAEFFTVLAGPQYSFLLRTKNAYTYGSSGSVQEQEFSSDNIRKGVFGFVAGTDIIIRHVVVSGRMGWDFQTNHGDETSATPRYKNKWLQFTIGFQI